MKNEEPYIVGDINWLDDNDKIQYNRNKKIKEEREQKINQILNETIPKERIPNTKTNLGICSSIQHSQERTSKDVNEDS